MPVELPGEDGRVLLVPRDEVIEFRGEEQARLFLARFMHDPTNMATLRRALAEESSAMLVARLDDWEVVTQVARRMVASCVALVRAELPPVLQPADAGGAGGLLPEEVFSNPLAPLEKLVEDLLPDAIIPPEFPRMALREFEGLMVETKQYGFVLDLLRFLGAKLLDGSALAPELPSLAKQTGGAIVAEALGTGMALKKLAAGGLPKPDPSALGRQLAAMAGSQGQSLLDGARSVGDALASLGGAAGGAPSAAGEVAKQFQQIGGQQARRLLEQAGGVGGAMTKLAQKAGAAPAPTEVAGHYVELGRAQAQKLAGIAAATAPALDVFKRSGEEASRLPPAVGAREFAFTLLDAGGRPVAGQKYVATVQGAVFEGTTGGDGRARVQHLPLNGRGTLTLPGCVWAWRDADGTLPGPRVHVVRPGETQAAIARRYGTSWDALRAHPANAPLRAQRPDPAALRPGDEVFVPDAEPRRLPIKAGTAVTLRHVGLGPSDIADRPVAPSRAPAPVDERATGPVRLVSLNGFFFETDKCFLLPGAMENLRKLGAVYAQHPGAEVLVVGHTDTAGSAAHNRTLSEERAAAVAAFLRDDVEAWAGWFGEGRPASKRWGVREVAHMLSAVGPPFWKGAVPNARTAALTEAVKTFQAWSNAQRGTKLAVDGVPGPMTQRALVGAYMALDGTSLPKGTRIVAEGRGEDFPAVATGDGRAEARNRRVEIFFFERGIYPPPPPAAEAAPPPAADPYPVWKKRTVLGVDLDDKAVPKTAGAPAVDVRAVARWDGQAQSAPLAGEPIVVKHADGRVEKGKLDAKGAAEIRCAGATIEITFPRRGPGALEALPQADGERAQAVPRPPPAGVSAADVEALAPVRRREFFLRLGRRGPIVASLQRLLNAAGANPKLKDDGDFGPGTMAAVKAFQRRHGQEDDGALGYVTLGALDEKLGLGVTFRCKREEAYDFRWRRFPARQVIAYRAAPGVGRAPEPAAPGPPPADTPSGLPKKPAAPGGKPLASARAVIQAAMQAGGPDVFDEQARVARAVIADVELLDEALRIGNATEDEAVVRAVYGDFLAHGAKNRQFANHLNYVRIVQMLEALDPGVTLRDLTRALRRVYYEDMAFFLMLGPHEPKIGTKLRTRLLGESKRLRESWQDIWGPRQGGRPHRQLDIGHALVALDAILNLPTRDRELVAWTCTDFGDGFSDVLYWVGQGMKDLGRKSGVRPVGAAADWSAGILQKPGNANASDIRGNDFGDQLAITQIQYGFSKLSALLWFCFHPARYLNGAANAENVEKSKPSPGVARIAESDPKIAR